MAETAVLNRVETKDFHTPDETRTFPHGKLELVTVGGGTVGRFTLEPGWKWSQHVKPIAQTDLCQVAHFQYVISGTLHVVMADGQDFDVRGGQVVVLPPGHDAWVVGKDPVVAIDWYSATQYAKP